MDENMVLYKSNLLAEKIRTRRKEKGMTQKELADMVGTSELSIRNYEENKRSPKYSTLISLDEVLDLNGTSFGCTESAAKISYDKGIYLYEAEYLKSDEVSTRTWTFPYDFTGLSLSDKDKNILAFIKACDNQKKGETLLGFKVKRAAQN